MIPLHGSQFVGERLSLARQFRALTQSSLAEQIGTTHVSVSHYESGKKKRPSPELVAAFADALGFAPSFFFLPVVDRLDKERCNFRHRRSTPERVKNQVRAHATLWAFVVRELRSLFNFPHYDIPKIGTSNVEDIEAAALKCREHWGLGIDTPIIDIGRVLERAGVVIVSQFINTAVVDAFSHSGQVSLIFLNQSIQSTSRWIFDIAHETGHLVLHHGYVTGCADSERAADRFASAFLLPRDAFSREFGRNGVHWPVIFQLKKRWRVSLATIVRRAHELGLIGTDVYRRAYKHMYFRGWAHAEPLEPEFRGPELVPMALMQLAAGGPSALESLVTRLHFTAETFSEVTGIELPEPDKVIALDQAWRRESAG